jgi:hypothetical protein
MSRSKDNVRACLTAAMNSGQLATYRSIERGVASNERRAGHKGRLVAG